MSIMKKVISLLVLLTLIFTILLTSAMASTNTMPTIPCPECATGLMFSMETEDEHEEYEPCSHNKPGCYDLYRVGEITVTRTCPECGHHESYTRKGFHTLVKCGIHVWELSLPTEKW